MNRVKIKDLCFCLVIFLFVWFLFWVFYTITTNYNYTSSWLSWMLRKKKRVIFCIILVFIKFSEVWSIYKVFLILQWCKYHCVNVYISWMMGQAVRQPLLIHSVINKYTLCGLYSESVHSTKVNVDNQWSQTTAWECLISNNNLFLLIFLKK